MSDTNHNAYPAGWYPDPSGSPRQRYYDGAMWTEHYHPAQAPAGAPSATETSTVSGASVPGAVGTSPKKPRRTWIWVGVGVVAAVLLIGGIARAVGGAPTATRIGDVESASPAAEVVEAATATVPDVVGMTAKEARVLIENAGLKVEFQAESGIVLDQDNWTVTGTTPGAGSSLEAGGAIVVQVTKTADLTASAAPSAPAEAAAPAPPQYTLEQQNALRSAQSYLSFMGFSRAGLIEQLSSEYGEGYPIEVATWAADTVGADWNAEAVESAQSYLELTSFSRDGLYEQLTSEYGEGFTPEQAEFALAAVGY